MPAPVEAPASARKKIAGAKPGDPQPLVMEDLRVVKPAVLAVGRIPGGAPAEMP